MLIQEPRERMRAQLGDRCSSRCRFRCRPSS
jgi:hypothetical protein